MTTAFLSGLSLGTPQSKAVLSGLYLQAEIQKHAVLSGLFLGTDSALAVTLGSDATFDAYQTVKLTPKATGIDMPDLVSAQYQLVSGEPPNPDYDVFGDDLSYQFATPGTVNGTVLVIRCLVNGVAETTIRLTVKKWCGIFFGNGAGALISSCWGGPLPLQS